MADASNSPASPQPAVFSDDIVFLQQHTDVIVLADDAGDAQIALAPKIQSRVMTSTADGPQGMSFGWINRELFAEGKFRPLLNPFGGEDRLWLGPEGGQFGIFFAKGSPFDMAHAVTPAALDTEAFELVSQDSDRACFHKECRLVNYSGTTFDLELDREVRLLSAERTWRHLGIAAVPSDVRLVAYESENCLTNVGEEAWQKESGLLSIWVLGMYKPSPATTVVFPIKAGSDTFLGPAVNADYFGQLPPDRLAVQDGVVYFSGDGQYRGKIGIGPRRCKPIMGSYDSTNGVLTLVQFTLPRGATDYVNSMWRLQDAPYTGDAANSYNDGPPEPGAKPLGPFYELESSSPAAALTPGETLTHVHRTIHITGPEPRLDAVAKATLGVSIEQIATALAREAALQSRP
jgi:hypothetical protein